MSHFSDVLNRVSLHDFICTHCLHVNLAEGYPLAGGARSPVKFVLDPLFTAPAMLNEAASQLLKLLSASQRQAVQLITGPAEGALPLAEAMATTLKQQATGAHSPAVYGAVRWKHNTDGPPALRGPWQPRRGFLRLGRTPPLNIVVVDDVITSRLSICRTLDSPLLSPYVAQVLRVVCLIDRATPATTLAVSRAQPYLPATSSVFTLADFIPAIAAQTRQSAREVRTLLGLPVSPVTAATKPAAA